MTCLRRNAQGVFCIYGREDSKRPGSGGRCGLCGEPTPLGELLTSARYPLYADPTANGFWLGML